MEWFDCYLKRRRPKAIKPATDAMATIPMSRAGTQLVNASDSSGRRGRVGVGVTSSGVGVLAMIVARAEDTRASTVASMSGVAVGTGVAVGAGVGVGVIVGVGLGDGVGVGVGVGVEVGMGDGVGVGEGVGVGAGPTRS